MVDQRGPYEDCKPGLTLCATVIPNTPPLCLPLPTRSAAVHEIHPMQKAA